MIFTFWLWFETKLVKLQGMHVKKWTKKYEQGLRSLWDTNINNIGIMGVLEEEEKEKKAEIIFQKCSILPKFHEKQSIYQRNIKLQMK